MTSFLRLPHTIDSYHPGPHVLILSSGQNLETACGKTGTLARCRPLEAVVSTRPGERHVTFICGEIPSSTGYLRPASWEPNLYIEVSEEDVEHKIKAMETYKGEARPDPHPRSREVLKALAKVNDLRQSRRLVL